MKKASAGFTLIELVIVIVILGILAATALPRFINVSDGAHKAAVESAQGALRSGVMLARAKWYAGAQDDADVVLIAGQPAIGQKDGWLTGNSDAAPGSAEHCAAVWNAVIDGPEAGHGTDHGKPFEASQSGTVCTFAYKKASGQPTIQYDTATGVVSLN